LFVFVQKNDSKKAEKEEEEKLKAKYPQVQRPGPQFLQKRLQKGVRIQLIAFKLTKINTTNISLIIAKVFRLRRL